MPKLLSRSKHEEFKSNSALQIKDQKERRAKSEEKWSIAKFGSCSTVPSSSSIPPAARSCFLRYALFAFAFGFFPFYPCNILSSDFGFFFFCNFPYTEHLYKPQSVKILYQSTHITSLLARDGAAISMLLPPFSFLPFSFIFFPLSRLPNTPLRMTTQRMVD